MSTQDPARWYCVDSIGLATLCHDEADARRQAEERSRAWPEGMPCRAVQLGDVAALAEERDSLLRDWVAEQGERTAAVDRAERAELERDRLTECLKKANSQAEHFEREWYLRGDECDRLRKSLLAAGFTDCGGELWKPPIPKAAKVLVDMLQETQAELEQARADVAELLECLSRWVPIAGTSWALEEPEVQRARALLAKHQKETK